MARITHLRKLLRRRGHRREDADDLIQEAFARLQMYCNEGNEVRSVEAFLVRTTLNLASTARRRDHSHLYDRNVAVEELQVRDTSPTPDEFFAAEECLSKVEAVLSALNPRTRDIFYMHRLDGMTYEQIADHFDISVSAIEKHIATAMAALGRLLHEESGRK